MKLIFLEHYKRLSKLKLLKLFIFIPLLIYLGHRSLIAYDEGFYYLQAKWILNNNNWITPVWWGEISLDRTIGIQALIALSQKIFGYSKFSIYIPNIIGSSLILFLTYKLHQEFYGKFNIVSPLILSTTYLWINYSHLATQDIIYSSLIILGIYSSIKGLKKRENKHIFFSGIWIGFAFMMKTYLTVVPVIALIPIFVRGKFISKKFFWLGITIGFIPFAFWSSRVIGIYGISIYSGLFEKFINLSEKNTFSKPFYYYLWNLPLNIFPWSIFALLGFLKSLKSNNYIERYILFFYPLINIVLLSLFSTKTPYYPLQIMPLISLNTYKGIINTIANQTFLNKLITYVNFLSIPSILLLITIYINSDYSKLIINNNDKFLITSSALTFSSVWICVILFKSLKKKIIFALLGPYLLTCILVQSGTLSDRSKDLRIATENLIKSNSFDNMPIEVVKEDINSTSAHSKIIKIALLMPKIGNGIKNLNDLKVDQFAWITNTKLEHYEKNKFKIVDDSTIFNPWKLVTRTN